MKKKLIIVTAFCGLILSNTIFADTNITLSPNDTYIAKIDLSVNLNPTILTGNAFYLCGALKPSCLSASDSPYGEVTNNGINYKIINGKLNYKLNDHHFFSSYTEGVNCSNFPPPPYNSNSFTPECSDISNGLSIGFINYSFGNELASGNINISGIEISANGTKPGRYTQNVYLNESLEEGVWRVLTHKTLVVTIADTTCSMQNQNLDMGNIIPGEKVKKKLNLNLTCNNNIAGASWKYTNLNHNGENNTNLSNVLMSLKNNKNDTITSDTLYANPNDLNDLSVEIDAKSNAEGGKLNVPLLFTLTYS